MLKKIKVEGMHCVSCALGLEEELEKLEFVKNVSVSFENKEALIECEDESFDIERVKQVVKSLNFEVVE